MNTLRIKKLVVGGATALTTFGLLASPALANSHVVRWHSVSGASSYNVYYTVKGKSKWWFSVPAVPSWQTWYKIKGLKDDGTWYKYRVRVLKDGAEVNTVKEGSFTGDNN